MKYKMSFRADKFEGLYPVYEPFFASVKEIGGIICGDSITFPDSICVNTIEELVKPFSDYIQLSSITD